MDSMFIWTLIFSGATIGLLATFLIASERELKNKRREIETLAVKLADSTDGNLSNNNTGISRLTDANTVDELKSTNDQLRDELGALASKLAASENRIQELDAELRRTSDLLPENQRLCVYNQELLDEISALKNQLPGDQTRDNLAYGQQNPVEDKCAALESELTRVKAELEESQSRLQELQCTKAQLAAVETREQEANNRCAELEMQTGRLTEQLAAQQEKLTQFDSLQAQLHHVEQRYEEARAESRRFQEEISRWQERLAASGDTKERLETLRRRLDNLHTKQAELAEKHHGIREEMLALTKLLDDTPESTADPEEPITAYEPTSFPRSVPLGNQTEKLSLEAVKKLIEEGSYEDALQQLDRFHKDTPENREIKLYQLLASVRLYRTNGYEKQIDSIAEMPDLSDAERIIARDIFLARAEEAQRSGHDNEMLRYRAWAKNVVYRTPLGTPEHDSSPHINDSRNDGVFASADVTGTIGEGEADGSAVTATDSSDGTDRNELRNGKTRFLVVATLIGLVVVVGVMSASSFMVGKNTAVPPPVRTVEPSGTNPTNETSGNNAPPLNKQSAGKDESPAVGTAPQNKASQSPASVNPRASREKNSDGIALASNKTQANKPSVKETQEKNKQQDQATANLAPGRWGTYEVVRATQLLREPREGSPLIANIDRGTRVNVVAVRDGWLEIRSKYGRPPGFIPRESAVRIQ